MLHIAFGILVRGAVKQMLARQGRGCVEHGHAVLQLVAKTDGAAGLVKTTARPEAAGDYLIQQPTVGQHIQGRLRGFNLHAAQGLAPVGLHLLQGVHGRT
ncbi:hypothetical protein D3C81_608930 [compost metagenome]